MSETGYLIRRLGISMLEISSWSDHSEPKGVYLIKQISKQKFNCDCPARGIKECRHIHLARTFIKNEINWDCYRMTKKDGTKF